MPHQSELLSHGSRLPTPDSPMEIIRQPRVTLIARPQFLEPAHLPVQWKGEASDGERIAEFAGRLCYMSQHNPAGRSTAEYLQNILKQGHGSVFEHSTYVMLIEGISRSCSHELVRHRAGWGYSQLSQRYVDESQAAFVMPPAIMGDATLERVYAPEIVALFQRVKQAFDPPGIFNPGVILPSHEPAISRLKVGESAVALPADVEQGLREIERTGGYARSRLELADNQSGRSQESGS